MNKFLLMASMKWIIAASLTLIANLALAQTPESQLAELERISNSNPAFTTNERAVAVANGFDHLIAPLLSFETMKRLSETELGMLFRAADLTVFYTDEVKYADSMQRILEVLDDKKFTTDKQREAFYSTLLQVRKLDEADEFLRLHPIPMPDTLPKHSEAANLSSQLPTEWVIDSETSSLERRNVDIKTGAHIVVVASPGCPFTRNAIRDISRDTVLMKVLDGHIKWLTPQLRRPHFSDTQQWNRSYPKFKMTMTYQRQEWTEIDHWGTPTFYFYKDGVLSSKLTGWPPEGNQAELKKQLKKIGLI